MDQQHMMPEDNSPAGSYQFYSNDQDPSYSMSYGHTPLGSYIVHAPSTRNQMEIHSQYQNIPLMPPYTSGAVFSSTPPHGSLPLSASPPPPSPEYDALSPALSGSDTSADGIYHHSNSSGANSPSSSRGHSLVHRTPRYNPTPSPTSSSSRRRGRSQDSDDEDMGIAFVENLASSRKEATRRQRIEAEQRRRDELRDGYAKLKDALPVSNQKSSKVSLLERATKHIIQLELENKELQARMAFLEQESTRLRALNEKISLNSDGTPSPEMGRHLTPQPDAPPPIHSLASVRGQQPPSEHSSPSASEGGH